MQNNALHLGSSSAYGKYRPITDHQDTESSLSESTVLPGDAESELKSQKKFIDSDSGDKVNIVWYKVMLDLFAGKYYC